MSFSIRTGASLPLPKDINPIYSQSDSSFLRKVMKVCFLGALILSGNKPVLAEKIIIHPTESAHFPSMPVFMFSFQSQYPKPTCSEHLITYEEFQALSSIEKRERMGKVAIACPLYGLFLMHVSDNLSVIYPKKGETVDECARTLKHEESSVNFNIGDCRFFTNGKLVCPNKYTFRKLKDQFHKECVPL